MSECCECENDSFVEFCEECWIKDRDLIKEETIKRVLEIQILKESPLYFEDVIEQIKELFEVKDGI